MTAARVLPDPDRRRKRIEKVLAEIREHLAKMDYGQVVITVQAGLPTVLKAEVSKKIED